MELTHWKILLIEDDEDDYILTRSLLQQAKGDKFELDWVSTYEKGLEACSREPYDVYLIDYLLGDRDGLELAREFTGKSCAAPIILLTGHGSYDVDMAAMRTGITDYLVKNEVNAQVLERTIRYAIERKHSEEALRRAHDELELRVQERTRELAAMNAELRTEIAERQRIEKALRESETRFRSLAETTSSAIFIVQKGKIRYVNPAVQMITGFSPQELVGNDFVEIAHPSYQQVLKSLGLVTRWAENIPARYELKLRTKHHQDRWVDVTAGEIEYEGAPALVVTTFDITERDLAEKELQKAKSQLEVRVAERTAELRQANLQLADAIQQLNSELVQRESLVALLDSERTMLSAIISNAPEGIVVADKDCRIVLTNPAADRLYGRPVPFGEAYTSHATLQICYPDGMPYDPRDLPLTRSALDGETCSNAELAIILPNGQRRDMLASSTPILDRKGEIAGAIAIIQDITERKLAEEEKRRTIYQIELHHHLIQQREMERLSLAQELHDGPVQELLAMTYAVADLQNRITAQQPEDTATLERLHAMQERLKVQINELRVLCSELRPPSLIPYGLEKAIRSHTEGFERHNAGMKINLDLEPDGTELDEKTRLALFRIYQETLANAARHAGVSEVFVRFRLDEAQAILEVRDFGRGFSVPHSWVELARQGHLGLVGVQERAAAVGGSVNILSGLGQGTTIQVFVPLNHA